MDTFKLVIKVKDIQDLKEHNLKDYAGAYIALNLCQADKKSLIHTDFVYVLNFIRSDLGFKVLAFIKDLDSSSAQKFICDHDLTAVALMGTYTSEYLQTLKHNLPHLELFVVQDPRNCNFETFSSIYKDFCTGFIAAADPWRKKHYYFEEQGLEVSCKDRCTVALQTSDGIALTKKQGFGGALIDINNIQ